MLRPWSARILTAALLVSHAFGQSGDWQQVRNLRPGKSIVISTKAGERYHGSFVSATDASILINSDERGSSGGRVHRMRTVPRTDVREVRLYRRDLSMLIGACIGAGAGIGLGAAAYSPEDRWGPAALFTLLGAPIGAMIGWHATLIKGKRVYVAP